MTRRSLLLAAAVLAGCVRKPPAPVPVPQEATALLAQADDLARTHASHAKARALYRRVLREYPGTPAAADALHALGWLYADPESPFHDWETANVAFGLLLTRHPGSRWTAEARAWHAALTELLRSQADARRLRDGLQRLKELDVEQEQVE
jgi:hypothetical protein